MWEEENIQRYELVYSSFTETGERYRLGFTESGAGSQLTNKHQEQEHALNPVLSQE